MENSGKKVGVFDSGIGGLTVLKECEKLLPQVRFYYLGDNANAPYGEKSKGEIMRLVRAAFLRFSDLEVDAAVLACNTATAVCADKLRREFSFPIVGMEPAVRPAALRCRRALVLCTPRTAESKRLTSLIKRFPQCEFTVCGCSDLAGEIERRQGELEKIRLEDHLPIGEFDGVVLGCTHYVFLKERIGKFYGVPVFDGNEGAARRLRALLGKDCEKNLGDTTTFSDYLGICDHFPNNTNNCSENTRKMEKKRGNSGVLFLGTAKNANKNAYKQMFAVKNQ